MKKNEVNHEFEYQGLIINGFLMLFICIIIIPALVACVFASTDNEGIVAAVVAVAAFVDIMLLSGLFVQQPNRSRVLTFFGVYKGTCRRTGFYWVNPFMSKANVSLRICNLDAAPIKVNDLVGNPVLIGMVLVWRVKDTYRAVFDVDTSLNSFVSVQSDAALREVTGRFAYDNDEADSQALTLRSSSDEINDLLERTLNDRLAMAGVEVVEARINYLAYAPEIAAVMLRRQQAAAIISAREKIVEGAVSMVKMALDEIEERNVAKLDASQRAAMVGNLLLVLCSDEPAQPVINSGN